MDMLRVPSHTSGRHRTKTTCNCATIWLWYRVRKRKKHIQICIVALLLGYIGLWIVSPKENVTGICNIAKIDIYSPDLNKSFWDESIFMCDYWDSLVYFNRSGYLAINTKFCQLNNITNITCSYSPILFNGQDEFKLAGYKSFYEPVFVRSDFVHVLCKNYAGQTLYSNLHHQVYNKEILKHRSILNDSDDDLSVIIIGLDSVSWLVAKRKLQHTLKYLDNNLNTYFLEGYTKVGDNTFSNLVPALLGRSLFELVTYPFSMTTIMTEAIKKGYIDSHADDWAYPVPVIGSFFPTYTHYLRPFIVAKTKIDMFFNTISRNGQITTHTIDYPLCFGNKFKHQIVLDYSSQVIQAYKNKRKFIFMWLNEIGHQQSNFVQYADKDIVTFLQGLKANNHLERSVVILMSDHGPRYGPLVTSEIGRFSGRLPLLALILPDQLTERFPNLRDNLRKNKDRLTSAFDLYETLNDIINKNFQHQSIEEPYPRGISLFKEIPATRSCYDAGISENNCACYSQTKISVVSTHINAAKFAVDKINKVHVNHSVCSNLSLSVVDSALIQHVPANVDKVHGTVRYVITFRTVPGNALFEVTIRYYPEDEKFDVLGDIYRRNKYEGQTNCVKFQKNEQYCFCLEN